MVVISGIPKANTGKWVVLALVCAALLIAVCGMVWLMLRHGSSNSSSSILNLIPAKPKPNVAEYAECKTDDPNDLEVDDLDDIVSDTRSNGGTLAVEIMIPRKPNEVGAAAASAGGAVQ